MPTETGTLADYFIPRKRPGETGLPVLSVTMNDGLVPRESLDRRTESAMEAKAHSLVEPGDIAYNMMRMWQGASGLCHIRANISPAYVVMTPKANTDPAFAAHSLKSKDAIDLLWAYSHGLTEDRLRLYPDDFLSIPTTFPALDDQRRIAAVLDTWDTALTIAERLVEAKRARIASVAHRLLAKSSSSDVPLDEVAEINGRSLGTNTAPDFEFEYFPIGDDEGGGGWMCFKDAPSRARRTALVGDVVYSTVRPLLRRIFRAPAHNSAVYSTGYAVLSPREGHDAGYLFHCMTTHAFESQILARLTGSNYPAIGAKDLGELVVPACDLPRQREIAAILDAATAAHQSTEALVAKLREQKRGLMQQLLTGKVPMPESIDALLPPAPELVAAA